MLEEILEDFSTKLDKTIESIKFKMTSIRAGRANIAMLNSVTVDYYGVITPLKQAANLSTLDAQTISIDPWDKSIIKNIEKGIQNANLGLNPSNDGKSIKISIPALTSDRRKEYVKLAKKEAEDGKIAIRNLRKEINNKLRKLEKASDISEDELKFNEKKVQDNVDKYILRITNIFTAKEKDINTI